MRSLLLIPLALLLSFVGLMPPASAQDGTGHASASNGVFYDGCHDHTYTLALSLPAGITHWSADMTLTAPDGSEASTDYIYGYDQPGLVTGTFFLCSGEDPGTYRISGVGEYTDTNYDDYSYPITGSSFTMRRAKSKVQLSASPKNPSFGQFVKMRVMVTDERPAGFFPTDYADVVLQRQVGGRWKTYPGVSMFTDEGGRDSVKIRWNSRKPMAFRALVKADDYSGSTSNSIRLR